MSVTISASRRESALVRTAGEGVEGLPEVSIISSGCRWEIFQCWSQFSSRPAILRGPTRIPASTGRLQSVPTIDPTIRRCRGFDDLCGFFRVREHRNMARRQDNSFSVELLRHALLLLRSDHVLIACRAFGVPRVTAVGFASKIESARLRLDSDKEGLLFRSRVSSPRLQLPATSNNPAPACTRAKQRLSSRGFMTSAVRVPSGASATAPRASASASSQRTYPADE